MGVPNPSSPTYITSSSSINMAQGLCRFDQDVSNTPSWLNIWILWFSRSQTYKYPSLSIAILCTILNSPSSVPDVPQEVIRFPLGEYLWIREFLYPSVTNIFPLLGSVAVWVHLLNGFPLNGLDGLFGVPIVNNILPSNVHCRTVWSPSSVQ